MRGKQAKKRVLEPDKKFNDKTVTQLINYLMVDGKKTIAQGLVYKAMGKLAAKANMSELDAFNRALENVKPKIELRSRRVGGANYQVPSPVAENRQTALAMRWILKATRESRGGKDSSEALFVQLWNSFNKEGAAYKKKEEVLKMAEANKAFSHLTW
jgi:small subunit ribosomal protein S7